MGDLGIGCRYATRRNQFQPIRDRPNTEVIRNTAIHEVNKGMFFGVFVTVVCSFYNRRGAVFVRATIEHSGMEDTYENSVAVSGPVFSHSLC